MLLPVFYCHTFCGHFLLKIVGDYVIFIKDTVSKFFFKQFIIVLEILQLAMPRWSCKDLLSFVFTRGSGCSVTGGASTIIWRVTLTAEFRP